MAGDIVERLLLASPYSNDGTTNSNIRLVSEAIAEIKRLRERLTSVERELADAKARIEEAVAKLDSIPFAQSMDMPRQVTEALNILQPRK